MPTRLRQPARAGRRRNRNPVSMITVSGYPISRFEHAFKGKHGPARSVVVLDWTRDREAQRAVERNRPRIGYCGDRRDDGAPVGCGDPEKLLIQLPAVTAAADRRADAHEVDVGARGI